MGYDENVRVRVNPTSFQDLCLKSQKMKCGSRSGNATKAGGDDI